jgi:hypothetical protein
VLPFLPQIGLVAERRGRGEQARMGAQKRPRWRIMPFLPVWPRGQIWPRLLLVLQVRQEDAARAWCSVRKGLDNGSMLMSTQGGADHGGAALTGRGGAQGRQHSDCQRAYRR